MEKDRLKAFADLAITRVYQEHLKPYLNELLEIELKRLDADPATEWDSLKRDISLQATKRTLRMITNKIDTAADEYSRRYLSQ